ncbi:MAG: hypothetical protein KDJ45_13505 [Hyphomicrobiaceae bacterium]|nr:hypothetical protein [Hyphomicrobiaceae bacterium]MCC0009919.1 hypothetical protein [Hyphomicrobiaceae bacterium]
MSLDAAALVLLSALLHPIRDLLLKGHARPERAYLAVTCGWIVIAAIHAKFSGIGLGLPTEVQPLAVASAACLTAYYFGTMAALKTGDLSIYYPIIRSSPLLIVAVTWAVSDTKYTLPTLAGIVLIVIAAFALQRQPGRILGHPKVAALALVAMAGSAGYTMADARAMHAHDVPPAQFLFWVYLMVAPAFALLTWAFRKPPPVGASAHLAASWLPSPFRVLAASVISYLSYFVILVAFSRGAGAAETAAVRQVSIPVSVLLAVIVLGETRLAHRLGWASLIAAGIILIVIGDKLL